MEDLVPIERIENKIYLIRGQKVMLDRDLAELYGVQTKILKQAVKRNIDRFPTDFMFELTKNELSKWRSQFVTSISDRMGLRWRPYAFTEQGVAMLSSILNSKKAIQVNILIIRAFVRLRQMIASHKRLAQKVSELEKGHFKHEVEITTIFKVLKRLMEEPVKPTPKIGFLVGRK
jgi:hypothetical protein